MSVPGSFPNSDRGTQVVEGLRKALRVNAFGGLTRSPGVEITHTSRSQMPARWSRWRVVDGLNLLVAHIHQ